MQKVNDNIIDNIWRLTKNIFNKSVPSCCTVLLRNLKYKNTQIQQLICIHAASVGHLKCLEQLYLLKYTLTERACIKSVQQNNFNCFKFLIDNKCPITNTVAIEAAKYGRLNFLIYLHNRDKNVIDADACAYAALNGHLDCLIFLREKWYPWNEKTCEYATIGKHIDCLTYAYTQGCPMTSKVCDLAAMTGNIYALIYAYENGCIMSPKTCDYAAKNGQFDCLMFAFEMGSPITPKTFLKAIKSKNLKCVDYAKTHCKIYYRYDIIKLQQFVLTFKLLVDKMFHK
jgi:hypothetical protein